MTSLLSQSYNSIKNNNEKQYASDIVIKRSLNISDDSIQLLESKTLKKHIYINSSDRMGCDISFILQKKEGTIELAFHK